MRWWTFVLVVGAVVVAFGQRAHAFSLGETMAATGTHGALASQSSRPVAGTVGRVQQSMEQVVRAREANMRGALGDGVARRASSGGGGTNWVTCTSGVVAGPGEAWATLSSGPGGGAGWHPAEAFAGAGQEAWATAADAWAHGGILPH